MSVLFILVFILFCLLVRFLGAAVRRKSLPKWKGELSFWVVKVPQEGQWKRKSNHFILLSTEVGFGFVLLLCAISNQKIPY